MVKLLSYDDAVYWQQDQIVTWNPVQSRHDHVVVMQQCCLLMTRPHCWYDNDHVAAMSSFDDIRHDHVVVVWQYSLLMKLPCCCFVTMLSIDEMTMLSKLSCCSAIRSQDHLLGGFVCWWHILLIFYWLCGMMMTWSCHHEETMQLDVISVCLLYDNNIWWNNLVIWVCHWATTWSCQVVYRQNLTIIWQNLRTIVR